MEFCSEIILIVVLFFSPLCFPHLERILSSGVCYLHESIKKDYSGLTFRNNLY